MKHHVIVREVPAALVMVSAKLLVVGFCEDVKRAGHAEMHEENVARGQVRQQIFRSPAKPGDGLAVQAAREILRQRPAQIGPAHLDPGEVRALHGRRQTAAHRLDFRQFGHLAHDSRGSRGHDERVFDALSKPWHIDFVAAGGPPRYRRL